MNLLTDKYKLQIDQICKEEGINRLFVFGSQARGDTKTDSDVDLLVEFNETPGLFEFVGIKQRFEELFEKDVDLVTERGLSKYIAPYIKSDLKIIYGQ